MGKRILNSFIYTAFFAMLCNLMIEVIVRAIVKFDYSPITPEFIAMFPSVTVAYGVNLLLYGMIGMAFSGFLFIYEKDRIGFVLQNLIYFVLTGFVWVPIVTFLWQLWRYPQALIMTIICFIITDIIMMVVGYRETKKNIEQLNKALEDFSSIT